MRITLNYQCNFKTNISFSNKKKDKELAPSPDKPIIPAGTPGYQLGWLLRPDSEPERDIEPIVPIEDSFIPITELSKTLENIHKDEQMSPKAKLDLITNTFKAHAAACTKTNQETGKTELVGENSIDEILDTITYYCPEGKSRVDILIEYAEALRELYYGDANTIIKFMEQINPYQLREYALDFINKPCTLNPAKNVAKPIITNPDFSFDTYAEVLKYINDKVDPTGCTIRKHLLLEEYYEEFNLKPFTATRKIWSKINSRHIGVAINKKAEHASEKSRDIFKKLLDKALDARMENDIDGDKRTGKKLGNANNSLLISWFMDCTPGEYKEEYIEKLKEEENKAKIELANPKFKAPEKPPGSNGERIGYNPIYVLYYKTW